MTTTENVPTPMGVGARMVVTAKRHLHHGSLDAEERHFHGVLRRRGYRLHLRRVEPPRLHRRRDRTETPSPAKSPSASSATRMRPTGRRLAARLCERTVRHIRASREQHKIATL